MTLPRGRDSQGNQGRMGEEGCQPAPTEDGEPERGHGLFPGSAQSETNLWLGREAPPVDGVEEGPVHEV